MPPPAGPRTASVPCMLALVEGVFVFFWANCPFPKCPSEVTEQLPAGPLPSPKGLPVVPPKHGLPATLMHFLGGIMFFFRVLKNLHLGDFSMPRLLWNLSVFF